MFSTAPGAGVSHLWSGTFNWLCQFDDDENTFQMDYDGIWSTSALKFTTVKL